MGTRGTVTVKDGKRTILVCYKQMDSYMSGLGAELQAAFGRTKIINGFNGQKAGEYANGMPCLAAQLVAKFKDDIGNFYITNQREREEFNYTLTEQDGLVHIRVTDWAGKQIYRGRLCDMPTIDERG